MAGVYTHNASRDRLSTGVVLVLHITESESITVSATLSLEPNNRLITLDVIENLADFTFLLVLDYALEAPRFILRSGGCLKNDQTTGIFKSIAL